MPVFPTAIDGGSRMITYRASMPVAGLTVFSWGGRTRRGAAEFGPWHRVDGVEWNGSLPAIGPAGTPAAIASVGAGRTDSPALGHVVRAYVVIGLGDWWARR